MTQIPADAARSEDGQWWWDGSQWQPVGDQAAGSGATSGAAADPAMTAAQEALGPAEEYVAPETYLFAEALPVVSDDPTQKTEEA